MDKIGESLQRNKSFSSLKERNRQTSKKQYNMQFHKNFDDLK